MRSPESITAIGTPAFASCGIHCTYAPKVRQMSANTTRSNSPPTAR